MGAAALAISRMGPALTWRALDGDLEAGEVSARLRPDNRWFLYFDTWRADAYPPLADAVARDLGRDLHVTLEDAEYDALDACAEAGFAVHRRESYYRIPTDPAVTGLAGAVLSAGFEILSAADADITRLRLLDDALRQDVPGSAGWRWGAEEFRTETFSSFFDPATYLVAVDQASGQYAGLVRIWRNRAGPRLGLIATLARYRRRGVARALLGQAFAVIAARGAMSVVGDVDDTNVAALSLLIGLGAGRHGGNVELIRRNVVLDTLLSEPRGSPVRSPRRTIAIVAQWWSIEVLHGEISAFRWQEQHDSALIEAALTNGVRDGAWHADRWGVVFEVLFDTDEQWDAFRGLPVVRAALDAVPDPVNGLLIYRGRGGGAGTREPRRPKPAPSSGAVSLPGPADEPYLDLTAIGPGPPR